MNWILLAVCGVVLACGAAAQNVELVCPLLPKPPGSETCDDWCKDHPEECDATLCTVLDEPGDNADDYERSGCNPRQTRCCNTPCKGTRCVAPVVEGCYTYLWRCYGAHTSLDAEFAGTSQGPMAYVDGQSTTGDFAGHVRQWEYYAYITGVEVTFYIMFPYDDTTPQNELRVYHTFKHTAREIGLQEIIMDIDLPEKARIGFEVKDNKQVPLKYRVGKPDNAGHYTSFIEYKEEGDKLVWNKPSVNRQYIFRMCFDTRRDTNRCPIFTTPPISSTTSMTTRDPTCRMEYKEAGCFGVPEPVNSAGEIQESEQYFYIDTEAPLISGFLTSVRFVPISPDSFHFMVWRRDSPRSARVILVYSIRVQPRVIGQLNTVRLESPASVKKGDLLGFKYDSEYIGVPMKYDVAANNVGGAYNTYECAGDLCMNEHNTELGAMFTIPGRRVQKRFRIGSCVSNLEEVCGPTLPPITECPICPAGPPGPPGPPGSRRRRRDVDISLVENFEKDDEDETQFFDTKPYNVALLVWVGLLTLVAMLYPIVTCKLVNRKQQFAYRDMDKPRM